MRSVSRGARIGTKQLLRHFGQKATAHRVISNLSHSMERISLQFRVGPKQNNIGF